MRSPADIKKEIFSRISVDENHIDFSDQYNKAEEEVFKDCTEKEIIAYNNMILNDAAILGFDFH